MIDTSTCLMVTASELMPSTHAVSHGAGQSRPVNSGKLFVACSRSAAACQSSRQVRSFHSGIRLPSGQPSWQNGMPQSMQRPAWRCSWSGVLRLVDLVPVHDAYVDRAPRGELALVVVEEALRVSHARPP